MLITVQFPIADARPFVTDSDLRLPFPDWPSPSASVTKTQFVHHFGEATNRSQEPDSAWPDETVYCNARRGIRFERLETQHTGLPGHRFRPRCAFRRLFCDGQAVVRVEIGIVLEPKTKNEISFEAEELLSIIKDMTELPTRVFRVSGLIKPQKLIFQGKYLAGLYAHASMNKSVDQSLGFTLVEAGEPLILVELNNEETICEFDAAIAKGFTKLDKDSINGAEASFCHLNTVDTWILQKGHASMGQLRNLRLCLTRLHAERVVLDIILNQIRRKRLMNPSTEEAVNLLDRYFADRIKIINREKWGGMQQSEILAAYDATQQVFCPAAQSQLITKYEGCRRQVWEKIEKYQEERNATKSVVTFNIQKGGITVIKKITSGAGSIINVAGRMSNVKNEITNNMSSSETNSEIESLISTLVEELEKIAPQVTQEQMSIFSKNIDALQAEIARDKPDKRWYELSLDGIREAAQSIGEMATPIITVVGKLSALLLV